jgi:oligoribonuclease
MRTQHDPEAPVLVIHQPDTVLDAMDSWNKSTHGKSGLVDKVKAATLTEGEAESRLIECPEAVVARARAARGNTVHQDRRFMARYMPASTPTCTTASSTSPR